ncbi:MAG: ASCH domain-containing protein [Phycisphaerales bacterium]|nr:ASCH domain-containing protein [Phycisphaerales bacterium]
MLLLKKHLVDLVKAGKKRQTIRFWSHAIVKPGQVSFTPGLGRMKILSIEELSGLHALDEADAQADGFESLAELLAELKRNYPVVPPGKRLFRIKFQWPIVQELSPARLAKAKPSATIRPKARKKTPGHVAASTPALNNSPADELPERLPVGDKLKLKAVILSKLAQLSHMQ